MTYDSLNRVRKVTDPDTGKVLGKYDYDDQGFRVRRMAEKAGPDGIVRKVELQYHNQYYGFERQLDNSGTEIPGTHSGVNNIYLNGNRIAAATSPHLITRSDTSFLTR